MSQIKPLFAALLLSASTLACADSTAPACQGTEVAPQFRGIYATRYEDKPARMTITATEMIYDSYGEQPLMTNKAWSCQINGADVLVLHFQDAQDSGEDYESHVVAMSGDYFIDLGEVYPGVPFNFEQLLNGSDRDRDTMKRISKGE
jgi:hypothetical protein